MASESEASCDADPNFAVICSFLEKFGTQCGLQAVDFVELQQMLENTNEVSPVLIDLHIKLMRKIRKTIQVERWERGIVKFCHLYSNQDAWEIERFGYKKARLSAKLRLLKELLEMQFDNVSFKSKINGVTAKELRSHPIGRDKLGNAYWYQIDDSCQIRVYKEDPDEETWALVAKDRTGLANLISKLSDNHDSSSTDAVTNEDSNSNNEETKTVLDTGQQDSNSSKKSSDDDKPPELKQEVDDEDTKMDSKLDDVNLKMPELVAPHEDKKPELSGVKEKYIRSDNFIQSNRKAVESAGFVDIAIGAGIDNSDLKRPLDEDLEEPSLLKRPRTARPTLLGNKKKPYQQEDYELDEEEEVEEEEEEDLDDEEQEDGDDEESEVGEEIEEPLMLVTGRGSGQDNKCENPIVGEVIEEEVMYFYGEGNGKDCKTGNEDKKEETTNEKKSTDETDSSIITPTKNNFKLGTIIDSKTDNVREKFPVKKTSSRWDIGKPEETIPTTECVSTVDNEDKSKSVKNLIDKFESIGNEPPVVKKPMFFFGPGSGFSFNTPSTLAASMKFGATCSGTNQIDKVKENDESSVKELSKSASDLTNTVNIVETSIKQNNTQVDSNKNNDEESSIKEKLNACNENKEDVKSDCKVNNEEIMIQDKNQEVISNLQENKEEIIESQENREETVNLQENEEETVDFEENKEETIILHDNKTLANENVMPLTNKLKDETIIEEQTEVTNVKSVEQEPENITDNVKINESEITASDLPDKSKQEADLTETQSLDMNTIESSSVEAIKENTNFSEDIENKNEKDSEITTPLIEDTIEETTTEEAEASKETVSSEDLIATSSEEPIVTSEDPVTTNSENKTTDLVEIFTETASENLITLPSENVDVASTESLSEDNNKLDIQDKLEDTQMQVDEDPNTVSDKAPDDNLITETDNVAEIQSSTIITQEESNETIEDNTKDLETKDNSEGFTIQDTWPSKTEEKEIVTSSENLDISSEDNSIQEKENLVTGEDESILITKESNDESNNLLQDQNIENTNLSIVNLNQEEKSDSSLQNFIVKESEMQNEECTNVSETTNVEEQSENLNLPETNVDRIDNIEQDLNIEDTKLEVENVQKESEFTSEKDDSVVSQTNYSDDKSFLEQESKSANTNYETPPVVEETTSILEKDTNLPELEIENKKEVESNENDLVPTENKNSDVVIEDIQETNEDAASEIEEKQSDISIEEKDLDQLLVPKTPQSDNIPILNDNFDSCRNIEPIVEPIQSPEDNLKVTEEDKTNESNKSKTIDSENYSKLEVEREATVFSDQSKPEENFNEKVDSTFTISNDSSTILSETSKNVSEAFEKDSCTKLQVENISINKFPEAETPTTNINTISNEETVKSDIKINEIASESEDTLKNLTNKSDFDFQKEQATDPEISPKILRSEEENISKEMQTFEKQSMPSNIVDVSCTPTYSISNLINEVPKDINLHDKLPKKRLKPSDDVVQHLPATKIPAVEEFQEQQKPEDILSHTNEELLDLSKTKVAAIPESNRVLDMSKLASREEAMDLSKPEQHHIYHESSHYIPETIIPPQPSTEMIPLSIPPNDEIGMSVGSSHESYDDTAEQIEEINVAKSFLIEKEPIQQEQLPESENVIDPLEEPVIIQEIGSISNMDIKKSESGISITDLDKQIYPSNEEEDIVKIRQLTNAPSSLEVQVPNPLLQPEENLEFVELQCVKQNVPLLTEPSENQIDAASDDDFDYGADDGGNASEPMDLEESQEATIIQHTELETKQPEVIPTESEEESVIPDDKPKTTIKEKTETPEEPKEETKPEPEKTLLSLSMDFTGEAPDLTEVQEMVSRARKRSAMEEAQEDKQVEESGGKRRKMRGKRTVDKGLRRSIEEAKNKEVSSSDEEKKKEEETPPPKPEKKKRGKRLLLGLEVPEGIPEISDVPVIRQSRRIAQLKIKEEAERRKLEEIALEEMKNSQKRKNKKDEDKDYKAEKRKHNKIITEDEETNDTEVDDKKKKKKRKKKHREFDEKNPWRSSSSDSSTEDSHVEEEEEEEEENYIETIKSDHEFSPESDLENAADPQPLKRARTVKKEEAEEDEEEIDDTNCQKCNKSDHPEWILLCDGCDAGWHCSCLRPALLVIPEGDWYCPPCQHNSLVKMLQDKLTELDQIQSKREIELRRKERLAYVGISLATVLPEKNEDSQKNKKERVRVARVRISGDEDSDSDSDSDSGSSNSDSSSGSSSSSSDSDEPIYKLRQRRQAHSYQFKDYDDLIKSAIQDEVEVKQQNEPLSKGKDMATIVQAEAEENKEEANKDEEDSDEDVIKPVKKKFGKKKHRKLNSLDFTSEEDEDSDEDFKGSSSDEDDDDDDDEYNSSSNSSIIGRKKGRGSIRRSTRARINRYDRDFINDDSEDSDEPRRGKRNRSDWEESDESEEESDRSWGRKKKRSGGSRKPVSSTPTTIKRKKSKKKSNDDSDAEVFKRKKPKIKFGGLDDDDSNTGGGKRRTRGKKINYLDALGTDSEEESRRRNQVKEEESEDEFVLNEEEEDVQDDGGNEDGSSDDSNIGGLVPAVKKGSKKGIGKGGIKRIKRVQGEEEEALFPPLPDAPAVEPVSSTEMNPIEQINKNLEAMDEKDLDMMMEDQDFANKQLQMVAAQLEKEKRRKEMEARKLEMLPQPAQVPVVQKVLPANIPSVIQAMPVAPQTIPPQVIVHPQHLLPMRSTEQLQPIHHDLPPQPMHHQLAPLLHQSPQHLPHQSPQQMLPHSPQHIHTQSPQHILHQGPPPPQPIPPMMMMEAATPKKRGRKPKSQLTSPEVTPVQPPCIPTPPSLGEKSDDSADFSGGFNADGTPKKRRGRGKGKKTLEKEAAAAAALAANQSPPTVPPVPTPPKPIETTKEPEPLPPPPVEGKSPAPPDLPITGGKLGVASAPQPFSQSQPKPSVITRMLQTQPGQPAYPVGGVTHNFGPERPPGLRPQLGAIPPFIPVGPGGIPPRGLHPGAFRPGANHYPVIRSGAPPPMRPQNLPPHLFHLPMENPGSSPMPERSSPAVTSPPSSSPLSTKSDQTPPPPYVVRPPMVRFPPTTVAPGGMPPRLPQMLPQIHPSRSGYPPGPPHNYHYAPPYPEGGPPFQVPPQYQEQQFPGDPDGPKNFEEEENGEFGGLVSYFSSQREDDLDT